MTEWWKEPFFQVALPLIFAFTWNNIHLSKRLERIEKRLEEIGNTLTGPEGHATRITRLEERTSPLTRR